MNIYIKFCALIMFAMQSTTFAMDVENQEYQSTSSKTTTMKGWKDCFKREKQYLSPFRGFIWWETKFLEKMFRFGNVDTKEVPRKIGDGVRIEAASGDSTILFLYKLFQNAADTICFINEPTHIAYYLNPKIIGKILNCLENPLTVIEWITNEKNDCKNKYKSEYGPIAGSFLRNKGSLDEKLKKLISDPQKIVDCIKVFESLIKITIKSNIPENITPNTKKEVLADCNKFVEFFVGALQESGDLPGREQIYPSYVPHAILLTFMYAKVKNTSDFKDYVEQFSKSIVPDDWKKFLQNKFDDSLGIHSINLKEYNNDLIDQNYEGICFSQINGQFYNLKTPIIQNKSPRVNYYGIHFGSCSEWAIRCMIWIIMSKIGIFDCSTQKFNLDELEPKMIDWLEKKSVNFNRDTVKEKLNRIKDLFHPFNNKDLMYSESFIQKWTEFVSDLDGIKYSFFINKQTGKTIEEINHSKPFIYPKENLILNQDGYYRKINRDASSALCQLAGLPSMFINLTGDILGLTFNDIKDLCSTFDLKILYDHELNDFNDEAVITRYLKHESAAKIHLETMIDGKKITFKISSGAGHSQIEILDTFIDLPPDTTLSKYLCDNYDRFYKEANDDKDDYHMLDLLMVFGKYSKVSYYAVKEKEDSQKALRKHLYFWFIRDLFKNKTKWFGLFDFSRQQNDTLNQLADKIFAKNKENFALEYNSFMFDINYHKIMKLNWIIELSEIVYKNENINDIDISNLIGSYYTNQNDELLSLIEKISKKQTLTSDKVIEKLLSGVPVNYVPDSILKAIIRVIEKLPREEETETSIYLKLFYRTLIHFPKTENLLNEMINQQIHKIPFNKNNDLNKNDMTIAGSLILKIAELRVNTLESLIIIASSIFDKTRYLISEYDAPKKDLFEHLAFLEKTLNTIKNAVLYKLKNAQEILEKVMYPMIDLVIDKHQSIRDHVKEDDKQSFEDMINRYREMRKK